MVLSKLQRDIENIYSLRAFDPVELYLMTANELRQTNPELPHLPQVLFQEKEGEALLGIYLSEETRRNLEIGGLENATLEDFCTATEEISHFVYLTHCASSEKKVSLLDLEVQAEVDKFLLATHYFGKDRRLFSRLFETIAFRSHLSEPEKYRYEEANRLGAKMARWLGSAVKSGGLAGNTLEFLRNFYRMQSHDKLNKVEKMKGI